MTEKWDLSDIFASSNDALVESKKVLSEYQAFRKKYAGKVASLKPMYFHDCISEYADIRILSGRVVNTLMKHTSRIKHLISPQSL